MKSLQIKQSITDRSDTALNSYLKDISKYPLLTVEEEKEVATKAAAGDKKARDTLIKSNLRFVVSCAKQYQNQGLPLIDLINEGNLGLIKAAAMFDVTRGFRFISYAVWWIRQAILYSLSGQSRIIRLPVNQIHTINKISKATQEFEKKYERTPSYLELEKLTDIQADKIDSIINSNNRIVSVDTPFKSEEEGTLIDVIQNYNSPKADLNLIKESEDKNIELILNKLSDREHDILIMFFGLGCYQMTLEEIGRKFGITSERVRQIKEKAIRSLKANKNYINKILNG
jgi:RNA polymerase primary sigma factor